MPFLFSFLLTGWLFISLPRNTRALRVNLCIYNIRRDKSSAQVVSSRRTSLNFITDREYNLLIVFRARIRVPTITDHIISFLNKRNFLFSIIPFLNSLGSYDTNYLFTRSPGDLFSFPPEKWSMKSTNYRICRYECTLVYWKLFRAVNIICKKYSVSI